MIKKVPLRVDFAGGWLDAPAYARMGGFIVNGATAYKYCGGGHGGYALYLFRSQIERDFVIKGNPCFHAIEPYCKRK